MKKCKTKAIHVDLGIFSHIPSYLDIFRQNQIYLGIIQTYSEQLYIQNQTHTKDISIFRTLAVSRPDTYSEPWNIQNQRHIQNPVKHLRWSFLQKQLTAIIIFAISAFYVLY